MRNLIVVISLFCGSFACAQALPSDPPALGIAMEGYEYPYPVSFMPLTVDGQDLRLAYMDVKPAGAGNGRSVMLFHGKNFFGAYWAVTIRTLSDAGYRVIVPDQIGFGKSSKPDIHYSFHRMATHSAMLLDKLGVDRTAIVGHSMGGMLAARFTLMYPQRVTHLIFENPIGLEDYREKIPYLPTEDAYRNELAQTLEKIRAYQTGYYVNWKDKYYAYVQV